MIYRKMGNLLAVQIPVPVMELLVAPVHDSKGHMQMRSICDERIAMPLNAFKDFPDVRAKLQAQLHAGRQGELEVQ